MVPALIAAGVGLQVMSTLMAGDAKKRALRRQAQFEEAQAAIALQDAQYERWRIRQATAARVSHAKVALSASGVDTSGGTPADAMAYIDTTGAMDAQLAEIKGNRVAWTHQERARLLRAGVEDVENAQFLDILNIGVGAAAKFAAIGSPADATAAGGGFNQPDMSGWDPAAEF